MAGDEDPDDGNGNGFAHRAELAVALAEAVGKLMGRIARQARSLHSTEAALDESRSELHGNMREAAELGVSNKAPPGQVRTASTDRPGGGGKSAGGVTGPGERRGPRPPSARLQRRAPV